MSTVTGAVEVQLFGTKKHADTRAALRFFSERRIRTHFVDLLERPASPGELQRFAQKFGAEALVDRASKRFVELGLGPARYGDATWISLLADEPLLLRQPLARCRQQVTVGMAPEVWAAWISVR
ncbi:MAG: arsenate reductase [Gemmatimonadetes bacterium]|nr:arsenate reductase [Gemmatimonadota bacterium]